jgi:S-adenosylmethionine:diacylglycerol 3-amino-3-carboxypropyl transferase
MKAFLGDMQDKAMFALIGTKIIYNVSWEDPRVDCELLDLKESNNDTILMLTSGGCNVLDMILEGASRVVAGDLNPRQNALLSLKCVAIKHLSFDAFFQLFAKGDEKLFNEVFDSTLKPHLSAFDAAYWSANRGFFKNVLWSGMSGVAARMMVNLCRWLGLSGLIDGACAEACR